MTVLSFLLMIVGLFFFLKGIRSLALLPSSRHPPDTSSNTASPLPSELHTNKPITSSMEGDRLKSLQEELVMVKDRCEALESQLKDVEEQSRFWKARYEILLKQTDRVAADAVDVIRALKMAWEEAVEDVRVLEEKHKTFEDEQRRVQTLLDQWESQRNEWREKEEQWRRQEASLTAQVNQMKSRITALEETLSLKNRALNDLTGTIKTVYGLVHQLASKIDSLIEEYRRSATAMQEIERLILTTGPDIKPFFSKEHNHDTRNLLVDQLKRWIQEMAFLDQKEKRMKEELMRLRAQVMGLKKICDAYRRSARVMNSDMPTPHNDR